MTVQIISIKESVLSKLSAFGCSALFLLVAGCSRSGDSTPTTAADASIEAEQGLIDTRSKGPIDPRKSVETSLEACEAARDNGDLVAAAGLAKRYLLANPRDPRGIFLAADIEARRHSYLDAVSLLDTIPRDDPTVGLAALGQSADWMLAAEEWDEAEKRFREVLAFAPGANMAHRRLAYVLNRQGRRQEAYFHTRQLCLAGDISMSELLTLISQSDAVFDEADLETDQEIKSSRPPAKEDYSPVGVVARARILFTKSDFKGALRLLMQPMIEGTLNAPGQALFGRMAVEVQDADAIELWFKNLAEEQEKFSDHWIAMGSFQLRGNNVSAATRLLCEAIGRNPTDWGALSKLENCMALLGKNEQADSFRTNATLIRKTIHLANRISGKEKPDAKSIGELAAVLESLGRPFEAVMWQAIAVIYSSGSQDEISRLNEVRQKLLADDALQKPHQVLLAGLNPADYAMPPKPKFESTKESGSEKKFAASVEPHLVDVAKAIGLEYQYLNAEQPKLRDTQIYEQFGGGIAAFDYDRNGRPDLYFTQGGADPKIDSTKPNMLMRNLGDRFSVANRSQTGDCGYGQGVTSGDWNQDGFPDLVIGNFGVNVLYINNGDGTFAKASLDGQWLSPLWTTSIAMADVSGDGLPDIVETNYIDDEDVHKVTAKGANGRFVKFKGPESYQPACDRIFVNDGQGTAKELLLGEGKASHGLGVVITDIDGEPGNEIFVANDTDPNQLWVRSSDTDNGTVGFSDVAGIRGCSFSASGGSGASMGIATADFDRNGDIDLHVTNFFNEPVHLYLQAGQMFTDEPIRADLYGASLQALGFGTQALDFDNNSSIDLAVLNGHIDDLQFKGSPHKMLPQLFTSAVGSFDQVPESDLSDFWQRPTIGRGLARLDWNADGKTDLVASHHDVPVALLENQTDSMYHWVQLSLVGTKSERDAIGARIVVKTTNEEFVEVVTSGDGFACKNESVVSIGLGEAQQIDQVDVRWPSGDNQSFQVEQVDNRYLLIEGDTKAFRCDLSTK